MGSLITSPLAPRPMNTNLTQFQQQNMRNPSFKTDTNIYATKKFDINSYIKKR